MSDIASAWYAVHTHSNAEHKASTHLERQGYQVYLPRFLKRRKHARRVEIVPVPLFPRYLFVTIDMQTQRWRSINSTIGVTRLVCVGDRPIAVPDSVVAELRSQQDESGFIHLQKKPLFKPGDKVQVVDGAFSSCLGIYEGMNDRMRVAILLDLLGRKVRVTIDADSVVAA